MSDENCWHLSHSFWDGLLFVDFLNLFLNFIYLLLICMCKCVSVYVCISMCACDRVPKKVRKKKNIKSLRTKVTGSSDWLNLGDGNKTQVFSKRGRKS